MGDFKSFMDQQVEGKAVHGQTGIESDWLRLGAMDLKGSRLLVADTDFLPEESEGVVVKTQPGTYVAEAKVMSFGGDRRVSRLRMMLQGANGKPGEQIGETWVDTAGTGVCAPEPCRKIFDELGEDDALERVRDVVWDEPGGLLQLGPGAEMVFVSAGFGDGTYPVVELVESGKRVGFEVEFIEPGTAYPFGSKNSETKTSSMAEAEQTPRQDKIAEMLSRVMESFQGQRTGDKEHDKGVLKGAFEEILGELGGQVSQGMADLRNYIIQVRKRPFQETMKFVSVPKEEWTARPAAREIVEVLENAGFKEIGSWHLQSNPALKSLGYLREHDHVTAGVTLIGEQPCLSMQTWFTDGSTFELTQTVKPKNPFPEWMQKVHRPDLPPGRFEEEFQRLCPPRERRKISEADYVNQVEDEFRRTQIWYLERGGLTRDELREMVTDLPDDEEQAAEALRMLRHEQAEFTLFQWLKQQSLPLDCDEQIEFIHIVHQAMDANLLRTEWMCATNDYKVREPEFAGPDPLEIFAAMNEKKGNPLQRLSRKETGLRADFYIPRDLLE